MRTMMVTQSSFDHRIRWREAHYPSAYRGDATARYLPRGDRRGTEKVREGMGRGSGLRRVSPLTRVLLLLVAVLFRGPPPSYASCAGPLSVAEEFRGSDAVFSGVAVRVDPDRALGPLVVSRQSVRFEVRQAWKGVSTTRVRVRGMHDYRGSDDYPFEEGRSYLVYAYGEDGALVTNGCKGTKPLDEAGADLHELGLPTVRLVEGDPGGGGPLAATSATLLVPVVMVSIIALGVLMRWRVAA